MNVHLGSVVFGIFLSPGSVIRFVHEFVVSKEHNVSEVYKECSQRKDEEVSPQRATHNGDEDQDNKQSQLTDVSSGREHFIFFIIIINFINLSQISSYFMVEARPVEEVLITLRFQAICIAVKEDTGCVINWTRGERKASTKEFKLTPDKPLIKLSEKFRINTQIEYDS